MKFLSGSLLKVISYLNNQNDIVEFIFIGTSDELVNELKDASDRRLGRDTVTIKFAINTNALVAYLYSRDWGSGNSNNNEGNIIPASSGVGNTINDTSKTVVIWGLISQLKKNGGLDATQLTKWLFSVMGAFTNTNLNNVLLADDVDINTDLEFDQRSNNTSNNEPNVILKNLLQNWMSIRKLY